MPATTKHDQRPTPQTLETAKQAIRKLIACTDPTDDAIFANAWHRREPWALRKAMERGIALRKARRALDACRAEMESGSGEGRGAVGWPEEVARGLKRFEETIAGIEGQWSGKSAPRLMRSEDEDDDAL